MKDYLLVLLSVVLLALSFMVQKLYQKRTPSSVTGGVDFSILCALVSFVIFFCIGGFRIHFTLYSTVNALLKSLCVLAYTVLGFVIMKRSNVATYMLFLMSGGMVVPAVYGWLFLDEPILPLHVAGIVVILFSVILSHANGHSLDRSTLFLCVPVFFLNGAVSVFSKLHQIKGADVAVSTVDYILISVICSLVTGIGLRLWLARGNTDHSRPKLPALRALAIPLLLVLVYSAIGNLSSYLQLEGARNLPAGVLYPMVTGGSIVFSGVLARIFFGERPTRREWLAIGLCFVGTCLFL